MSEKEITELGRWIEDNVIGHVMGENPAEGKAAAMEVWEKCFEHPACGQPSFQSKAPSGAYWIRTVTKGGHVEGEAKTLPLAICLFAKQLFSKEQP